MNTKSISIIISVPILLILLACMALNVPQISEVEGSGNIVTESRPVSGFSKISIGAIGELTLEQGDQESLEITADDNLMSKIKSEVRGDTLHIYIDAPGIPNFHPSSEIKYKLTMKSIERIEVSGAVNLTSGKIKTDSLEIETSGAGEIRMAELTVDKMNLEVSGAGTVTINGGEVSTQDVLLSGAGSYDAGNLKCTDMVIEISGAGKAEVWVEGHLEINLSGAGSLVYYGSPTVDQDISGAGHIKSLGDK